MSLSRFFSFAGVSFLSRLESMFFTIFSVSLTDNCLERTISNASFMASSVSRGSKVLACPGVMSPLSRKSRTFSGSDSSLREFVRLGLDIPTIFAVSSCVRPNSSVSFFKPRAISTGLRSSLWRFSTSITALASVSDSSLITTGISVRPAIALALQRRSPDIILYFPESSRFVLSSSSARAALLTTIGCKTPCEAIESASAFKASSSNFFLG